MSKKRNPADATIRNVQASKKRTDKLDGRFRRLRDRIINLEKRQWEINDRLDRAKVAP